MKIIKNNNNNDDIDKKKDNNNNISNDSNNDILNFQENQLSLHIRAQSCYSGLSYLFAPKKCIYVLIIAQFCLTHVSSVKPPSGMKTLVIYLFFYKYPKEVTYT